MNLQRLALGEGIADIDGAVVVQADDIPGVGLLGLRAVGSHERERIGNPHFLVQPHVKEPHAARVPAGAQPQESDAVTVHGVHVGLDLEHKAREGFFQR